MNRIAAFALAQLAGCIGTEIAASVGAGRTSPGYETGQLNQSRQDLARTVREAILRKDVQIPDVDVRDRHQDRINGLALEFPCMLNHGLFGLNP